MSLHYNFSLHTPFQSVGVIKDYSLAGGPGYRRPDLNQLLLSEQL